MSEGSFSPTRDDLRMLLRRQLEASESGLRLVAENVLAVSSTIDLVGVDSHGRAVLVWMADTGRDLETFTRTLAGRSWAGPRIRDWAQLAPALKLRPESGVRCLLICSAFDPETLGAAASLGEAGVELILSKQQPHELAPGSIEWVSTPQSAPRDRAGSGLEAPAFRSGLSEEELGLSPEERAEFD